MSTRERPSMRPLAPMGFWTTARAWRVAVGAPPAVVRAPAANAAASAGMIRRLLRDMPRRLRGERVEQRVADVEHPLEGRDRDALVGLVVALGAVGEVGAGEA